MFDQSTENQNGDGYETTVPAWQRLHGEMKSATRRRSAWDAEHARHLREAEAMQLWHHFGHVSILEYLEREHGIEPRTASDRSASRTHWLIYRCSRPSSRTARSSTRT